MRRYRKGITETDIRVYWQTGGKVLPGVPPGPRAVSKRRAFCPRFSGGWGFFANSYEVIAKCRKRSGFPGYEIIFFVYPPGSLEKVNPESVSKSDSKMNWSAV
jgi:hypothetical protein